MARSSPGDDTNGRKERPKVPEQPSANVLPPARRTKPFIERAPEPVQQPITMTHYYPATTHLPEVVQKPEVPPAEKPKPEDYSSIQKKKPPNVEEKASKPEVPPAGSKNKKGLKFNGAGGRIHTEAQIDRILDEFILTGKLPSYVSERQRYDYRHHIRLPERRKLLATGNKASGTSATTGTKDNITHFPGTGTHDS